MKSTEGAYYRGLDQVRAVAVFLVFFWHFSRASLASTPAPLSVLAQGYTGVAIFMTLSGYLFAKLVDGKAINYLAFLHNRFLRLAPLLLFMIAVHILRRLLDGRTEELVPYLWSLAQGMVLPTWPNGAWSITVEAQFYAIFPLILLLERKRPFASLVIVLLAFALRIAIGLHYGAGTMHDAAYWTLIGCIDQFVWGILFWRYGAFARNNHYGAALVFVAVLAGWSWYLGRGGFYASGNAWPWLLIPTLQGAAYGFLISWYDRSFQPSAKGISGMVQRIGEWSYSIYLLHFFAVNRVHDFIDARIMPLTNFWASLAWDVPCFLLTALVCSFSYRYFESYFLRFRKPYLLSAAATGPANP